MKEAKLSISQRKDIGNRIADGKPLVVRARSAPTKNEQNLFGMKRNYFFSKRSREKIENAGYYETEPYTSHLRPVDREKERELLQHVMTYGKRPSTEKTKVPKPTTEPQSLTKDRRLQELQEEIEDRIQFLRYMTHIGQGSRYEAATKQEIAAKLRERSRLEKITEEEFSHLFNGIVIKSA